MTFDRMWVLAIAWLPLAWMVFEWRRTARRSALVLKGLSLVSDSDRPGRAAAERIGNQSRRRCSGGYFGQRVARRSGARVPTRGRNCESSRASLDARHSFRSVYAYARSQRGHQNP